MTLFHDGDVVTVDGASRVAEALLVRDGRVAEVGGEELVERAGEEAVRVDLGGRTVVPGFIDAHNHFSFSAFEPDMVDCSTPPLESLDELLGQVANHCAGLPDGLWVRGWGFHSSQVKEGRNPTRQELDEAAPRNPFVLVDVSFHACYVNSPTLRATQISRDTPDPPGGVIERDGSGEPTGTLLESAADLPQCDSWLDHVERDRERALDLIERQCRRFLALGITTICDALVIPEAAELYDEARRAGKLLLSVSQLHGGDTFFAPPRPGRQDVDLHADDGIALRGGMVKIFMDGTYPSPAIDRLHPGGCVKHAGVTNYAPAEVAELALQAAEHELGVAIHCSGNRAVEQALEAFTAVRRTEAGKSITLRIEHSFIGRRGQAARLADLGVLLVTQPGLARDYGHVFSALRGDDQPQLLLFPVRSMLDAGVRVAGSSDYPCGGGLAPLSIMSAAVNRRRADGEPIEPEEAIDRERALRMYTLDAARACDRESIEGSLAVGKRANLVVLDRNPLDCDPAEISVLQTWVDGELRFQADYEPSAAPDACGSPKGSKPPSSA